MYDDRTLSIITTSIIIIAIIGWTVASMFLYNEVNKIYMEKEIVAKTICAEACSEGAHVLLGVANTIQNRIDKYNMTAYEVVTQPNQYYGYTNPNRDKIFEDLNCREISLKLSKNMDSLVDITDGALYFRVEGEKIQHWHEILTVKIDRVYFYK